MTILREFGIVDKIDRWNLSEAPGKNLKDAVGQRIQVKCYLLIEDTNRKTGEIGKILKVMTPNGEIYGTGSVPFISMFERYLDFMETNEIHEFGVGSKPSTKGNPYLLFIA